jgi:hypothetical protein
MKTQAPEQLQSLTLSLRISQGLHDRLESIRKLASHRRGGSVSTSEIAKQLLESAQADWLEVAELLRKPSEALLAIRRKGESGQPLTRVEWTALAHYVREGVGTYSKKPLTPGSYIGILQAFQAVYELRVGTSDRDQYYLGNFPLECRPQGYKPSDPVTPDVVRCTVEETLRRASKPGSLYVAEHAARNLFMFLEEENIAGVTRLNEVLSPYWPVLWRVAARGHYLTRHEPVREIAKEQAHVYRPPIPSVREGGYTLSFERAEGNEFHLLLCFPGRRGPMYPMSQYPKLAEFRAMLAAFGPDLEAPQDWNEEHFFGYVVKTDEETDFCFRAHNNGITFSFSRADWASVRELFRKGWEIPEIRLAWDALTLEYGELW